MGWGNGLKKQMTDFSQKALERLFADEKRATRIANAIGTVQRGKAALDRGQDELMRALNFAPGSEFKKLGRQLAGRKERGRGVGEEVKKSTGPRGGGEESE